MPKCPHCGHIQLSTTPNSYNWGKLVAMANGYGSSDVVIKCEYCNEDFRVLCSIRFYGSKKDLGD